MSITALEGGMAKAESSHFPALFALEAIFSA